MLNNWALLQYILTVHTSINSLTFWKNYLPKLIWIFFSECHESYVPHRWRDFWCPAGYFWSPTAWQRSFYGCRGCSDCWEKWYVNIISLQNVLMIFYQYWSQQHMMAMHAHSQGPVRVKFQQVKWPWKRDLKQQKWRQMTQREVETPTLKYWQRHGYLLDIHEMTGCQIQIMDIRNSAESASQPFIWSIDVAKYFFQLTTIVVFCCLSNASSFSTVLENVANLLRVDIYELSDALTQKSMILRGEEILSPLSVEQVCNYKWLLDEIFVIPEISLVKVSVKGKGWKHLMRTWLLQI